MSKPFKFVMGAIVLFVLFFVNPPSCGLVRESARRSEARNGVAGLCAALKQYHTEYGVMPEGDQARIISALLGENPKKIVFFEAAEKRFNARGGFIDPLGTPYRIDASNPASPRAYSFGKDKKDDGGTPDSDDIASWQ